MRDAIDMGLGERTVTVDRQQLIETLKKNREKHQKDYQDSLDGYKEDASAELAKQVQIAQKKIADNEEMLKNRINNFDPNEPLSDALTVLSSVVLKLKAPRDHTRSYDVAISMAEWEVSETVELTQSQFQCFVLDDWDWTAEFNAINATYSKLG